MRSFRILLSFVLFLGAYVSPALAQTESARRLEVTVLDTQGLPIVGARVTASQTAINLSRTAASATEKFILQGLPAGEYTIRVSASGFQMQEVTADLRTQPAQS